MEQERDFECLKCERDGSWITIWFDDPNTRNALTSQLQKELSKVLEQVRSDSGVRGITLRGTNGMFCSGGDLKTFRKISTGATHQEVVEISVDGARIFDLLDTMPQFVIVLVEGAALAGGLGLACCADVILCTEKARFALTETSLGIVPAQIAPYVLRRLGYAIARRLLLAGARFDGAEAKALGLVDYVESDVAGLTEREFELRSDLLRCAPGAVAATKEFIASLAAGRAREDIIQNAAQLFAERVRSGEGQTGLSAFFQKRAPDWVPHEESHS